MDQGKTKQRSERIREDIELTRAEMDDIMDRLSEKLRPRHLADDVAEYFRSGKGADIACTVRESGQKMVQALKDHPVPALLAAGGIIWLVAARKSRAARFEDYEDEFEETWAEGLEDYEAQAGRTAGRLKEAAADARSRIGEYAGKARQSIARTARHVREGVSDKFGAVGTRVQHGIERGRDQVTDFTEEYPLAMGAACMALGVLAGLLIPNTRRENRILGRQADRMKNRLRETGGELVERGRSVVDATVQQAREAAEREGLTPSALKNKAQRAAQDVAETAGSEARGEAREFRRDFQRASSTGKTDAQKAREQADETIERLTQS